MKRVSENPSAVKRCSRGERCAHPDGPLLPATSEFFSRDKSSKDGYQSKCKKCASAMFAVYREKNLERELKRVREYHDSHKLQARIVKMEYRQRNHESILKQRRDKYTDNAETLRADARERAKRKRDNNPDFVRQQLLDWQRMNRPRVTIYTLRRKSRKRSLPDTFTLKDWERALAYFDYRCAICGVEASVSRKIVPDHWIALSDPRPDNPGTVSGNIVPLCHGKGGCNNSKHCRDANDWLKKHYGDAGLLIAERIQAYFAWVREQDT